MATLAHIRDCELCRYRFTDEALTRLLRSHTAPAPREDFEDVVIGAAVRHHRQQRTRLGAIAASIVACAVLVAALTGTDVLLRNAGTVQIALAPSESRTVQLLIDSIAARDDATIRIELADDLELNGFPGQHVIEWQTSLAQGKNLLQLPVRLQGNRDSRFTVALHYGNERKEIEVRVDALDPTSA